MTIGPVSVALDRRSPVATVRVHEQEFQVAIRLGVSVKIDDTALQRSISEPGLRALEVGLGAAMTLDEILAEGDDVDLNTLSEGGGDNDGA